MIGAVFSIASLPPHFVLSKTQSIELASTIVAVVGAIYVGFALQRGDVKQIAIEIVVAMAFLLAALVGMWLNPWAVPAAYVLHGAWDFAHHRNSPLVSIPVWYPPFCAVYDWVFAFGLIAIWWFKF